MPTGRKPRGKVTRKRKPKSSSQQPQDTKKSSKKAAKKAARQQAKQAALARLERVKAAAGHSDGLALLPASFASALYAAQAEFTWRYFASAEALGDDVREWMYKLTETNMRTMYEAHEDWGWHERAKREELTDVDARFIVVFREEEPVAFTHLRFLQEGDECVAYVYEIQVDSSQQRKSIGKWMMQAVERIAWQTDMDKVVLTVFTDNPAARGFYIGKLGYVRDSTDLNDPNYLILSRSRPVTRRG